MGELKINLSYPHHPDYTYETFLERINLDEECSNDIKSNRGFIVGEPHSIKKDLKDPNGIFSIKFGQTLRDLNPFADRYKCECGETTSRIHHGIVCKKCLKKVKYVSDDFGYFGWIILKEPYRIIHPNLYKSIEFLIGSDRLIRILTPMDDKNQDGYEFNFTSNSKDEPYTGLGMLDFYKKFDEIMEYYNSKFPDKSDYYHDIMKERDKVFTHSVPVYTTHLRPFEIDEDSLYYEGTNGIYNMINRLVSQINNDELKIFRKKKPKNQLLYDTQMKFNELYKEIENIISGKKGTIRTLLGGRYNFSSRSVIIPNPKLRIDEVILPYSALVELLQQQIINILHKSYNISYSDAYNIWYRANIQKDQRICDIINALIKNSGRGLPLMINRNPTIAYGGILQMFCVGMTDTYTMGVPLQILPLLAADFDGDVLNIFYIINKEFFQRAYEVFNPRNVMYISRNDGLFDNVVNHQRDTLINANTLVRLARSKYTKEQLAKIQSIKISA
jgi:hypothetical protein